MRPNILKFCRSRYLFSTCRKYSTSSKKSDNADINRLRNIGILAHIDAGKTTTTERMLFYSGTIGSMGEVHHGNTVTDYMEQERERGITITSAAVTFDWSNYQFNLIDTPGHIDFTMEVEQTLNVLDGAVVILDGSAGVEAQTLTVWRQADRYEIPKIIFVNKMDRGDACIQMSLDSIRSKLDTLPVCLQIPIKEQGKLTGIVDVLTLEKVVWDQTLRGKQFTRTRLTEEGDDGALWEEALNLRSTVTDQLSSFDDELAEKIIQSESLENVSTAEIVKALKKATIKQKAVPVLCGSAYKNIGIQPLMDAVILYLPSPAERKQHFSCFDHNLCARAFKTIYDKHRGPLVFFRIYSGNFSKGQRLYNIQKERSEQTGKLLVAYADDFKEVDSVENGNIAVVTGLRQTMTGDLVTSSATVASQAKKALIKQDSKSKRNSENVSDTNLVDSIFQVGARIPEPVFFCSIEPPSLAYQSALDQALMELSREDPSLRVSYDTDTGQTVLAGMGELHLDIIKTRIKSDYKIDADLGPLQIAYKEMVLGSARDSHIVDHKIGSSKQHVNINMSVKTTEQSSSSSDVLRLDKSPDSASNISAIYPKHLLAVKNGVDTALAHGPKLGCPVVGVSVMLHWFEVGRGTSESIITASVTQCIRKLLEDVGTTLLEPIMLLEIVTNEDNFSVVLADLSRRRAAIQQITVRGSNKVVQALTPLSELLGYSTVLRTITSGTATFSIQYNGMQQMTACEEAKAIRNITGF